MALSRLQNSPSWLPRGVILTVWAIAGNENNRDVKVRKAKDLNNNFMLTSDISWNLRDSLSVNMQTKVNTDWTYFKKTSPPRLISPHECS